jgi:hypothetical protein
MVEMGTYEELFVSSPTFAQLLEDINQHEKVQQSVSFTNQQSMIGSISSEKGDDEEDANSSPTNLETKQEGRVKRDVYTSYLRAGVGIILGPLLIIIIFSTHQAIGIYSNWWLAAWSNDQSRRYQNLTNCTNIRDKKSDEIYLMSDVEWNRHQDHRFHRFCGLTNFFLSLVDLMFNFSSCSCTLSSDIASHDCFTIYMFKCCTSTS